MKKTLLILSLPFLLIQGGSCIKNNDCKPKSVDSERATIMSYATTNGLTLTAHSSGLYYQINNPGSGATPTANSVVSVRYTGKLLNGTVFDSQSTAVNVPLSDVITGWKIGLPLLQKGGSIRLIIPSSMGYGCNGFGTVPPDAILDFEIDLVDVL